MFLFRATAIYQIGQFHVMCSSYVNQILNMFGGVDSKHRILNIQLILPAFPVCALRFMGPLGEKPSPVLFRNVHSVEHRSIF